MGSVNELLGRLFDQQIEPGAPKYIALRDAILKMIELQHWQVGDKLPPEQELTKLTGISLGTVQRALGTLADAGHVYREQGRGTFVAQPGNLLRDPWHFRFVNSDGDALLPVYVKALSSEVTSVTGPWSDFFGEEETEYVCIKRMLDVNHEFLCYNLFYLGAQEFRPLAAKPLSKLHGRHIKQILADEFGAETRDTVHRIRAMRFDAETSAVTESTRGTTGMLLEIYGSTRRRRPLYFQRTYIPPSDRWLAVSE